MESSHINWVITKTNCLHPSSLFQTIIGGAGQHITSNRSHCSGDIEYTGCTMHVRLYILVNYSYVSENVCTQAHKHGHIHYTCRETSTYR